MIEEWREVKGYEKMYQVSSTGIVRSIQRKLPDGRLRKGAVLRPYKDKDGYMHVSLSKSGKMKHYSVHRLVAEAFVDNPQNFPQVNHIDENKGNNNADNLEWCDARYNLMYGTHQEKIKRKISGEKHYAHKLTIDMVIELRRVYKPFDKVFGVCALSRKYGMSQTAIQNAISGKTWKCVKEADIHDSGRTETNDTAKGQGTLGGKPRV